MEVAAALAMVGNKRPEKMNSTPDELYELLGDCLNGEVSKRPRIVEVSQSLLRLKVTF